jgi:hypothetical protein
LIVLAALAATLLIHLAARTEIVSNDALRYIGQARQIEAGAWRAGLVGSVDHPVYPVAIAAAHSIIGGTTPESWQSAAQFASVLAGVLLVVPLYLIGLELFGPAAAMAGTLLVYLTPLNGPVLADALSEGTFLLWWSFGLWTALRFLRRGEFRWLPPTLAFAALAYLVRPEGLLLPASLVGALMLMPLVRGTHLNWRRWWVAVAFLVIGPVLVMGPYVAIKGGLGTKPAIARILGTAPASAAGAVERARPLDPTESTLHRYAAAVKATWEAVRDAVSIPLLPFAALGGALWFRRDPDRGRLSLFLGVMTLAAVAALVRLHVTGGYCTPRHAMVLGLLGILAAGRGLEALLSRVRIPASWLGDDPGSLRAGPGLYLLALMAYGAWSAPILLGPLNHAMSSYRDAGLWLAETAPAEAKVVDLTGWSHFYGDRVGFTFADVVIAGKDPATRYVVAREAHLVGPWPYCEHLRGLVAGRKPLVSFPEGREPGRAQVHVFDLTVPAPVPSWAPTPTVAVSPAAMERGRPR